MPSPPFAKEASTTQRLWGRQRVGQARRALNAGRIPGWTGLCGLQPDLCTSPPSKSRRILSLQASVSPLCNGKKWNPPHSLLVQHYRGSVLGEREENEAPAAYGACRERTGLVGGWEPLSLPVLPISHRP